MSKVYWPIDIACPVCGAEKGSLCDMRGQSRYDDDAFHSGRESEALAKTKRAQEREAARQPPKQPPTRYERHVV